jgi:hypothetical protein
MTQRRPRLGDILDDYCPRERRITNHAVVAMVEDAVKQTRCTTCDTEHEFKHAKVPTSRKRKSETPPAHLVEAGSRPPSDVEETHEDAPEPDLPVMADDGRRIRIRRARRARGRTRRGGGSCFRARDG